MEINYIGNNLKFINILKKSKFVKLNKVITIKKKYKTFLFANNNKHQLINLINKKFKENSIFLIFECDLIIPKILIKKHTFFNIHRGRLKTNRGPVPEVWTILNGCKNAYITLHKINEKIDLGEIICEKKIFLKKLYNVKQLRKIMSQDFVFILKKLNDYLNGKIKGKKIYNGIYNSYPLAKDFTINLAKDPHDQILNKIKSQESKNGAILYYKRKKIFIKKYTQLKKYIS